MRTPIVVTAFASVIALAMIIPPNVACGQTDLQDAGRAADARIQKDERAAITRMRADIGKTFWIVRPNGRGIEICTDIVSAKDCRILANFSFKVVDVAPGPEYLGMWAHRSFKVQLQDGTIGYVHHAHRSHFLSADPVAAAKAAAEECERRGQPKIGMKSSEAIETCWRAPKRIVKSTTVSGVREDYIYSLGHILRFDNGLLSEVIETR